MSKPIIIGDPDLMFGLPENSMMFVRPIWFPIDGKIKIRVRDNDFVRVFIRSENSIRAFIATKIDDFHFTVKPTSEFGRNHNLCPKK